MITLEIADSFIKRLVGLIGRSSLPPGYGLLLPNTSSIHTCLMQFSIDLVYIDYDNRICKRVCSVMPWRYSLCMTASSVLELRNGEIERLGIQLGDHVELIEGQYLIFRKGD